MGRIGFMSVLVTIGILGSGCRAAPPQRSGDADLYKLHEDVVYVEREESDPAKTSLDVYVPADVEADAPVLIYVHGGGWSIGDKSRVGYKARWAVKHGWVFVSVNYRLSPEVMHPEHARDVSSAIDFVLDHAQEYSIDPDRVALMGHSAGAHLVAIVCSDESLLGEHDRSAGEIDALVLLDGAGYNLNEVMPDLPRFGPLQKMYRSAFGEDDPELWERASPSLQADEDDDLPATLAVYAGDREESRHASIELVGTWSAAGCDARVFHAPHKDHARINRELGKAHDEDSEIVGDFIEEMFDQE